MSDGRSAAMSAPALTGRRVAILEARMGDVLARLLEREGAIVVAAPAVIERPAIDPEAIEAFVDTLHQGAYAAVIFQTGSGATALFTALERQGRIRDALEGFRRTTVVSRGPKPAAVLHARGVQVGVHVAPPWTTTNCIESVSRLPLEGRQVALLHYGEANIALADALRASGAALDELTLYEWALPEDVAPIVALVDAICAGDLDAVVFTTQIQVRHLMEITRAQGREAEVRQALATRTTTAAIGPTCAAALVALGVEPDIVPLRPKMGALVAAVSDWFAGATTHDA